MRYDGLDDNEAMETVFSNSECDQEAKENVFEEQVEDEIKMTPKTTPNPKVVLAIKNLHVLYNEDANKIVLSKLLKKYSKRKFKIFDLS